MNMMSGGKGACPELAWSRRPEDNGYTGGVRNWGLFSIPNNSYLIEQNHYNSDAISSAIRS
ncbi:hypothetical protein GCM10008985_00180 [Halococcus dombrowskii]|uniref:Uncharacterized protein n=1 Tax=Halococcus dombrowskii TaxID=179637 RepID=A0AAV3SAK7_HALDO